MMGPLCMEGVLLSTKPAQEESLLSTNKSSGVPGSHFLI